jgi:DNA repair exonuclease SbcCD nuclease subunit
MEKIAVRFVHSSDWHVGEIFRFADEASGLLQDERLEAIGRLARLARAENAPVVLVAGDVYDAQSPTEKTLRQPIERMRAFPDIAWHLIPGNHDPDTPRGPWERLRCLQSQEGLPDNLQLHLRPEPAPIGDTGGWLLPGVITRRLAVADSSAEMDAMITPEGAIRIGLAHGSIASFGSDPTTQRNPIAPDRAARAGLAYLALGDWHGAKAINERCWYSGTPETDGFDRGGGGEALVVEIDGPAAIPAITRHRIGRFTWTRIEQTLHNTTDIDVLETRLRGLSPDPGSVLVWLSVSGVLSLAELEAFESRIGQGLGSALRVLRIADAGLIAHPTAADLEAVDHTGFLRTAADNLASRAADSNDPDHEIAAEALQRLYVLSRRLARASGAAS